MTALLCGAAAVSAAGRSQEGAGSTPSPRRATRAALHLLFAVLALPLFAQTNEAPKLPGKVSIAQKLGTELPKNLVFRNDRDEIVRLGDLMKSGRPVLLNFVYFNCPMLCPMTLEGLTNTLSELKFDAGKEFDIITVSIDPRDKVSAAAAMKDKYVKRYGRLHAANNWHFLMANETTIKRLADSVGFQFAYDPHTDQFAHGAALLILTPDGRTSRYFYGFEYKARDLRLAIVEASGGKIGTATDQFLLLCFHYDPATGKYSRAAMNFARVGGGVTVAFLGSFIFLMLRKERGKPQQDGHESL